MDGQSRKFLSEEPRAVCYHTSFTASGSIFCRVAPCPSGSMSAAGRFPAPSLLYPLPVLQLLKALDGSHQPLLLACHPAGRSPGRKPRGRLFEWRFPQHEAGRATDCQRPQSNLHFIPHSRAPPVVCITIIQPGMGFKTLSFFSPVYTHIFWSLEGSLSSHGYAA